MVPGHEHDAAVGRGRDALRIPGLRPAVLAVPAEAAAQPVGAARGPRRAEPGPERADAAVEVGAHAVEPRRPGPRAAPCARGAGGRGSGSIERSPRAGGMAATNAMLSGAGSVAPGEHARRPPDPPQHRAAGRGAGGQLGDAPALGRRRLADARRRRRASRACSGSGPRSCSPRARSPRCRPGARWTASAACPCSPPASDRRRRLRARGARQRAAVRAGRARRPRGGRDGERDRAARAHRGRRHVPARAARARHRARAVRGGVRRDPRPVRVQPAARRPRPRRRRARRAVARRGRLHARRRSCSCSPCGPTRCGSPSCCAATPRARWRPRRRCARSCAAPG